MRAAGYPSLWLSAADGADDLYGITGADFGLSPCASWNDLAVYGDGHVGGVYVKAV